MSRPPAFDVRTRQKRPAPWSRQAARNGSIESRAEVGVDRERVGERRIGAARLEERGRVGTRRRADVSALRVGDHEQPCLGGVARRPTRARSQPSLPSASKNATCGFTATTYGATASTIPLQNRSTAAGRRRAPEHGLAAELDGQQVDPWIEPDDELAPLALDRLGDPIGELGNGGRLGVRRTAHAAKATPFTAARIGLALERDDAQLGRRAAAGRRRREGARRQRVALEPGASEPRDRASASPASISCTAPPPARDGPAGDDASGDEDRPHHPRLERRHDEAGAQRAQRRRARPSAPRPARPPRSGRAAALRPRSGGRTRAAAASAAAPAGRRAARRPRSPRAPAPHAARSLAPESGPCAVGSVPQPSCRRGGAGRHGGRAASRARSPAAAAHAGAAARRARPPARSRSGCHSTRASAPSAASTAGRCRSPEK